MAPEAAQLLSTGEVARLLGISSQRVIGIAKQGGVPCHRTGAGYVFYLRDVEALAQRRQQQAETNWRVRVPNGLNRRYRARDIDRLRPRGLDRG